MTKFLTLPSFFCQSVLFTAVLATFSVSAANAYTRDPGAYFAVSPNDAADKADVSTNADLTFLGNIHYETEEPNYSGKYSQNGTESKLAKTHNLTDMAIGVGSSVDVLTRRLDDVLLFGLSGNLINNGGMQENIPDSLAVGSYSHARSGSIEIGSHSLMTPNAQGGLLFGDVQMGDTTVANLHQDGVAQTTLGTNAYTNGSFAVTVGAYSVQTSKFDTNASGNEEGYFTTTTDLIKKGAAQNTLATINGSLNSNESTKGGDYSGMLNVITGAANTVNNSNGTTVIGSGNTVKNSSQDMGKVARSLLNSLSDQTDEVSSSKHSSPRDKQLAIQKVMQDGATGEVGAGLVVFGSGNTIESALNTTVSGFHNDVNTASNVIVLGDNRKLTNVSNSIFLGSATNPLETSNVKNAIAIGFDSNVTVDDGIALGKDSWSSEAANTAGWDLLTQDKTKETNPTWISTRGAFAVGGANATRRISGVAAGSADTDAVNVAQLKAVTLMVTANGGTDDEAANINGSGSQNLLVTKSQDSKSGGVHYDVKLNDKLALGGDATSPNITIDGTTSKVTVGSAGSGKEIVMDGANGVLTADQVTLDATTNEVTGLSNTTWDSSKYDATRDANRAATEGQLKTVDDKVTNIDTRLTKTEEKVDTLSGKANDLTKDVDIAKNGLADLNKRVTTAEDTLKNLTGMHWVAKASANNGGELVGSSTPQDVKNGETVNFGVANNLKLTQEGNKFTYELRDTLTINSLELQNADGTSKVSLGLNDKGQPSLNSKDPTTRLTVNGNEVATLNDGMIYKDDAGNEVKVLMNNALTIKGGATNTVANNNIGVVGRDGALSIQLSKDIDLGSDGSLTAGGMKIDGKSGTISGLSNKTWDATQVDPSRAATEGQLRDLAQNFKATDNTAKLRELERDVNRMDTNIRDAGATAAALAGLKPLQYDPEKPTQAFGAVGAYRGREAIALGLGHYLNQDMLIHAGVGIGAHKMANAGFSMKFAFGEKKESALTTYQVEPMKAVYQLEGEMKVLQMQNQQLLERNQALDARNADIDQANAQLMANNEEMEKKLQRMAQQLDALEKKMAKKP